MGVGGGEKVKGGSVFGRVCAHGQWKPIEGRAVVETARQLATHLVTSAVKIKKSFFSFINYFWYNKFFLFYFLN